jgi:hypothetical protein
VRSRGDRHQAAHGELPHLGHSEREVEISQPHVGRASSIDGASSRPSGGGPGALSASGSC